MQGSIYQTVPPELRLQGSAQKHLLQEACHAFTSFGFPSNNIDCLHSCLLPQSGSSMEAGTVSWSSPNPTTPDTDWHQERDYDLGRVECSQQKLLGTYQMCHHGYIFFDKSKTFLKITCNLYVCSKRKNDGKWRGKKFNQVFGTFYKAIVIKQYGID